jgi:hypothetical protein
MRIWRKRNKRTREDLLRLLVALDRLASENR